MFLKRLIFKVLSKANRNLLPSYRNRDLSKLSKMDKIMVGFKYWVTTNYFENK